MWSYFYYLIFILYRFIYFRYQHIQSCRRKFHFQHRYIYFHSKRMVILKDFVLMYNEWNFNALGVPICDWPLNRKLLRSLRNPLIVSVDFLSSFMLVLKGKMGLKGSTQQFTWRWGDGHILSNEDKLIAKFYSYWLACLYYDGKKRCVRHSLVNTALARFKVLWDYLSVWEGGDCVQSVKRVWRNGYWRIGKRKLVTAMGIRSIGVKCDNRRVFYLYQRLDFSTWVYKPLSFSWTS